MSLRRINADQLRELWWVLHINGGRLSFENFRKLNRLLVVRETLEKVFIRIRSKTELTRKEEIQERFCGKLLSVASKCQAR